MDPEKMLKPYLARLVLVAFVGSQGLPGLTVLEAAHAAPVPVTLSRETLLVSDARIIVGR